MRKNSLTPEKALSTAITAIMRAFLEEPAASKPKKTRRVISRQTKPRQLNLDLPEDFPEVPRMDLPLRESPQADIPPVTPEELKAIEEAMNRDPSEAPPGYYNRDDPRESPAGWMAADE